jgi:hypothetical protein
LFVYLQRANRENNVVSTGLAEVRPQAIQTQSQAKSETKKQSATVEQLSRSPDSTPPAEKAELSKAVGQFDPTYCPRPGDNAVIGQPIGSYAGLFQFRVIFYREVCYESLEALAPAVRPTEVDGHLDRTPTMQLAQTNRYLLQAGTRVRIIDKASTCYDLVFGQEHRVPIFKIEVVSGPLQGKQLYARGVALQQETKNNAEPWTMEDVSLHSLIVLESDNPEYVLAQYKQKYMVFSEKHIGLMTSRLLAHNVEPPTAERERFQKPHTRGRGTSQRSLSQTHLQRKPYPNPTAASS